MRRFSPTVPIRVDDVLLVSSLGLDGATAIAAARAGVSRPSTLPGFAVTGEDGEDTDVNGYPVGLLTDGFEGAGRYRQLLGRLFADVAARLAERGGVDDGRPLYLLLGVPSDARYTQGPDIGSGDALDPDDTGFSLNGESWESILDAVLCGAALDERFDFTRVVETTTVGSTRLLQMAHQAIARRPDATVLVVTVDTLTDRPGLLWLQRTGRLRTATHPVGVGPGEGASALFLTGRSDAMPLRLDTIVRDEEPNAMFEEVPPEGKALANLLGTFVDEREDGESEPWTIANLSGEQKPFHEWGMATVHCGARTDRPALGLPELPAMFVGELGVGFLGFAVAMIVHADRRGYAPAARCAIVLCDHTGERALVSIRREG